MVMEEKPGKISHLIWWRRDGTGGGSCVLDMPSSTRSSRLVKYPTNMSVISFQDASLVSPKLSVALFKDLGLISGSGYTTSQLQT